MAPCTFIDTRDEDGVLAAAAQLAESRPAPGDPWDTYLARRIHEVAFIPFEVERLRRIKGMIERARR